MSVTSETTAESKRFLAITDRDLAQAYYSTPVTKCEDKSTKMWLITNPQLSTVLIIRTPPDQIQSSQQKAKVFIYRVPF